MSHILTLNTFAPLVGALAILILRAVAGKSGEQAAGRSALWIALGTTVATFALSVIMQGLTMPTLLKALGMVEPTP